LQDLLSLFALEHNGYIDLYFGDESGISLTPSIPYGWQKRGRKNTQSIPTQRSAVINVFGLLSRDNRFESYITKGSNTSATIIAYIDDFATKITKKTIIVLDNAPIHKSNDFIEKMAEWEEMDLFIFFLPPYSPHFNLIETLWRKIKYEWLKASAYISIEALQEALCNILVNIGTEYTINFKQQGMSVI